MILIVSIFIKKMVLEQLKPFFLYSHQKIILISLNK